MGKEVWFYWPERVSTRTVFRDIVLLFTKQLPHEEGPAPRGGIEVSRWSLVTKVAIHKVCRECKPV